MDEKKKQILANDSSAQSYHSIFTPSRAGPAGQLQQSIGRQCTFSLASFKARARVQWKIYEPRYEFSLILMQSLSPSFAAMTVMATN